MTIIKLTFTVKNVCDNLNCFMNTYSFIDNMTFLYFLHCKKFLLRLYFQYTNDYR